MGLALVVAKEDETSGHCVYAFGTPTKTMGRVRLHKSSGDIEVNNLADASEGPNPRFVLAQVVPRLHDYYDRSTYPPHDQWEA
jgi:hypothetical protein